MAQEIINVGVVANDGQGDPIRSAFTKTNNNFSQLFAAGGVSGISNGTSNITILDSGAILMSPQGTANVITVTTTGATVTGTLVGSPNISATGNVLAGQFFIGNGSQLSGVVSTAAAALITGSTLSSNVLTSSLTTVGTLGTLSVTGNIRGGNILTPNDVVATGNVAGSNFNAGLNINASGNVTGGNVIAASALSVGGVISGAGNVDIGTQYFIGNGSQLSGIAVSSNAALLTYSTLSSNVTISSLQQLGNLSYLVVSNALGNGTMVVNGGITTGTAISATGNITGGNINTGGVVSATGNITTGTGNIGGGNLSVGGNVIAVNIEIGTEIRSLGYITAVGNVIGSNLVTAGFVTTTGNVVGGNLTTAGIANVNSLRVPTTASVTGNITGGNVLTGGIVSSTANIIGGNILTGGIISATGNVTAPNFIGNVVGNISGTLSAPGANTQVVFNDTGVANATAGMVFNKTSNAFAISGNITGGNLITAGDATVGGNVVAGGTNTYLNTTNIYAVDPIVSFGRNANNQPLLSSDSKDRGTQLYYFATSEKSSFIGYQASTGNLIAAVQATVTGEVVTVNSYGNLVVGTLLGSVVSATANVIGGNISTGGVVSAGGNITGANLLAAGLSLSSNVISALNVTANIAGGNILTPGLISVAGNVTGGNILTGGLISATGNITGGNLTVSGNTATVTTASYQIGYRDLPQNTSFGTLAATDGGKHYYGSGTITIPGNGTVPFNIGTAVLVIASASTTISPAVGVTLVQAGTGSTGSRTLAADGMATLVKVSTNTWYINGTGIS